MEPKAKIGYWKIRGLANPILFMLEYTATPYEHITYEVGDGPDYDNSCWSSVKEKMGFDFPNLPHFEMGDVKITQSSAILRFLARKNNLYGKTPKEQANVDMLLDTTVDVRSRFSDLCYNPDFEQRKEPYVNSYLPGVLARFEKYLGDKHYIIGDSITMADFPLYEVLYIHGKLVPGLYESYPKLKAFIARFEAEPKIAKYMKSDHFISSPINNKMSSFN